MWGHPVVLAETFTDPARHYGGCYRAANFTMVGETAGWGRSNGSYRHHGNVKAVWVRELRRGSHHMLAGMFDHPVFTGHPKRTRSVHSLVRPRTVMTSPHQVCQTKSGS